MWPRSMTGFHRGESVDCVWPQLMAEVQREHSVVLIWPRPLTGAHRRRAVAGVAIAFGDGPCLYTRFYGGSASPAILHCLSGTAESRLYTVRSSFFSSKYPPSSNNQLHQFSKWRQRAPAMLESRVIPLCCFVSLVLAENLNWILLELMRPCSYSVTCSGTCVSVSPTVYLSICRCSGQGDSWRSACCICLGV
jgi:hypothetical protein